MVIAGVGVRICEGQNTAGLRRKRGLLALGKLVSFILNSKRKKKKSNFFFFFLCGGDEEGEVSSFRPKKKSLRVTWVWKEVKGRLGGGREEQGNAI